MSKEVIRIITTSDGSHSLYNEEIKETYHSTHGAITESQHVFIKEGIDFLLERDVRSFNILEIGFGTGLNALLAYHYASKDSSVNINYLTLEPFPISSEVFKNLNYLDQLDTGVTENDFLKLHGAPFDEKIQFSENFSFTKHKEKLEDFKSKESFNLVFYDAFAPSKQSEMWEMESLGNVYNIMESGAVLTTYCAQGQFKRNLIELGLEVQSIDGPPGKKEMTRAVK